MTTQDDDFDFDEMFRQLTDILDVEVPNIPIVLTTLTDLRLLQRFNDTRRQLHERHEMINPTTDDGKDLHAEYHGYLLELKKRRLK